MMALEEKFDLQLDEEGEALLLIVADWSKASRLSARCSACAAHVPLKQCAAVRARQPRSCVCLLRCRCREDLHSAGGCRPDLRPGQQRLGHPVSRAGPELPQCQSTVWWSAQLFDWSLCLALCADERPAVASQNCPRRRCTEMSAVVTL